MRAAFLRLAGFPGFHAVCQGKECRSGLDHQRVATCFADAHEPIITAGVVLHHPDATVSASRTRIVNHHTSEQRSHLVTISLSLLDGVNSQNATREMSKNEKIPSRYYLPPGE